MVRRLSIMIYNALSAGRAAPVRGSRVLKILALLMLLCGALVLLAGLIIGGQKHRELTLVSMFALLVACIGYTLGRVLELEENFKALEAQMRAKYSQVTAQKGMTADGERAHDEHLGPEDKTSEFDT